MTPFLFEYAKFYTYYMDTTNLIQSYTRAPLYYFKNNPGPRIIQPKPGILPRFYIQISGGVKVYVSPLATNEILFTIPNNINSKLYSDHYHFGLNNTNEMTSLMQSFGNIPNVFFHKTIQLPHPLSNGGKAIQNCWFRDKMTMTNVKDVICTQQKSARMLDKFPFHFAKDIEFIQEIIARPFLGIQNQGGGKYTVKMLKELAKKANIKGYYKMNKRELFKMIYFNN